MTQAPTARLKGPLDAGETADAAITAALIVALLAAGRVLAAGSMMQVVASFVVAVLAARRRNRAVIIATAAAACIALILGGLGPVTQAGLAGVFGWCGGQGLKRSWGRIRSIGLFLIVGWPAMAFSVMFVYPAVAINRKLRELVFENVENQADGVANILNGVGWLFGQLGRFFGWLGIGFLHSAMDWLDDSIEWVGSGLQAMAGFLVDNWLLLIPATELVYTLIYAIAIRAFGGGILRRLEKALVDPVAIALQSDHDSAAPVPATISDVALTRNGVTVTNPVNLRVEPGEHLVIQGPNGAGKSTLLDTLAGIHNHGAVSRPGPTALGHVGGTARIGQRPEAQVVGTTVGEDLRWGLTRDPVTGGDPDIAAILADVGLNLPEDRATSDLSGGELQRLALASALRRKPTLLLADEVTSMLDPAEQERIIARLDDLDGATIVRTSHRNDAAASDRRVRIRRLGDPGDGDGSAQIPASPGALDAEPHIQTIQTNVTESRLLRVRGVGFAHAADKPWRHEVLTNVDLSVHRYEMIVIEGRNGSGKTTLARLIAGVEQPTSGEVVRSKGVKRALAHQHVRLQLLKPTVQTELFSLAGVRGDGEAPSDDRQRTRAANLETTIDLFELDRIADRRIDELSGGEQRRVLLAGLVARGVSLLVLDEPLAGLDRNGREDLARALDQVRLAGTSIVVVSHDIDWTPLHLDQHLRLDGGRLHTVDRAGSSGFPTLGLTEPGAGPS